jgi:cobalt-zinc-cadmium efflux system outer membrane protein
MHVFRFVALAMMSLLISAAQAQQTQKKVFPFRGRVEQVNAATKRIIIQNEPIEGWMGEMTMGFAVDSDDVFQHVKVGDEITAKVYEGDFTLHDLQVVPPAHATVPSAANQGGMRLEELEQMALANNPTVGQAQANLRVAAGLARQVGLYPNPTVGYYGDEIRGGYLGGGKQGGFVSQSIVLGGKLRAARRVAEVEATEVETSGQIQRLRIQNNVRTLFYQILAAQRLVVVRQNLAKVAADVTQTSRQLGNVGQADRPDILQAEVEQQQVNVSLAVAQQNLQAAWRVLAAVIGKPDLALVRLEGDLDAIPDLNYEEWVATTLRESPEVELAQQAVERGEASLVQAKKTPIPDLQVTGLLVQSYEPLDTTRKPTGLQGGAQIGVQLPIFNRNQGGVAAAKGEIESAKQELTRIKLQLQRDLASMFRDYDSARLIVQRYREEMLPRAEQAYRLYQRSYQQMAGAYPQVLISQRTLFQLETEYVQALENAWMTSVAIRGFGLMDGLSEPIKPSSGGQSGSAGMGAYPGRAASVVQ